MKADCDISVTVDGKSAIYRVATPQLSLEAARLAMDMPCVASLALGRERPDVQEAIALHSFNSVSDLHEQIGQHVIFSSCNSCPKCSDLLRLQRHVVRERICEWYNQPLEQNRCVMHDSTNSLWFGTIFQAG